MTTMRDLFDQGKLTLHRLNSMWSPTGKTLCYHTDHWLRQSVWNDSYPQQSIVNLHYALANLQRAYGEWNSDGLQNNMTIEWNNILSGVQYTMNSLRDCLNRKDIARIEKLLANN